MSGFRRIFDWYAPPQRLAPVRKEPSRILRVGILPPSFLALVPCVLVIPSHTLNRCAVASFTRVFTGMRYESAEAKKCRSGWKRFEARRTRTPCGILLSGIESVCVISLRFNPVSTPALTALTLPILFQSRKLFIST